MNHTFYSTTAHTSDRDLTTQNPASLGNLYTPPPSPPQHQDLMIVGQLRTNESIDLRHERLTSKVKHLSLRGGKAVIMLPCAVEQCRPEQSKYVTESSGKLEYVDMSAYILIIMYISLLHEEIL